MIRSDAPGVGGHIISVAKVRKKTTPAKCFCNFFVAKGG